MQACCPTCDRLCEVATVGGQKAESRQRWYHVVPHPQPVCPECTWLATFVTDETPGRDAMLITGSGHYTCLNGHTFEAPIDGAQCTGHKKRI